MSTVLNLKSLSDEELLEMLVGVASVRAVFGSCLFFYPVRTEVLRRTPARAAAQVDQFIHAVGRWALHANSPELHNQKRSVLFHMKE